MNWKLNIKGVLKKLKFFFYEGKRANAGTLINFLYKIRNKGKAI